LTLLYVGHRAQSASAEWQNAQPSDSTKRIRYHMRGNAYGSTLR